MRSVKKLIEINETLRSKVYLLSLENKRLKTQIKNLQIAAWGGCK